MKKMILILPAVLIAGCGPQPNATEGAREANELCAGHVGSITAVAKNNGRTHGLIVVCADGKAHPIN